MLDPRIYRAAFVPVALAVVVAAFSLYDQQGALGTSLAPDAFSSQNAFTTLTRLAYSYPNRRPGSASDDALATEVGTVFSRHGFGTSNDVFSARTADGTRTIETVTGLRTGFSSRPIVVIAHRDAAGSPASTELSGTAVLLELARVLSGRTLNRTVVLASTSGSVGDAGAVRLARRLGGSLDAVLVLGDLAASRLHYPLVVPYSDGAGVAPTLLRNTVAAALGAQAGLRAGEISFGGQFAHLAFPLALTEQGPFGARGVPAVLLSASSDHGLAADAQPTQARMNTFGRTALQTISALEDGSDIPAPTPYLVYDKKIVPAWAVRLLVLMLILPALVASIDGLARARRRGQAVGRCLLWVLSGSAPFAVGALLVVGLKLTGLLRVAPPEPVGAGTVPLHTAGVAILIASVLLVGLCFAFLRPAVTRLAGAGAAPSGGAAPAAIALVLSAVTITIWAANPFAAALLVPALHLWMWGLAPEARVRAPLRLAIVPVGLVAVLLVVAYYAVTLGLGPVDVAWSAVLMLAGGHIGVVSALQWSIVLGCAASVAAVALRTVPADQRSEHPITVRGPATYAGPGSLGGTKSALRR